MPIIRGIKRIDPLNLNKNVTIGVAFPLDETNMFKGTETVEEQTKANLINLLLTEPGERINLPKYGVGLKKLLFQQNIDLPLLKEKITQASARYIPTIQISNVAAALTEDKHTMIINIVYRSVLNGEQNSIQLNFN